MTTDSVTKEQCIAWLQRQYDEADTIWRLRHVDHVNAILSFLRSSAEPQATREPKCGACDGSGEREPSGGRNKHTSGIRFDCLRCRGSGTIPFQELQSPQKLTFGRKPCPSCTQASAVSEHADAHNRLCSMLVNAGAQELPQPTHSAVSGPVTYANQPDNLIAWRLGEACQKAAADPKCGDYIDRGLILLRELEARGLGIVRIPSAK